MHFIKRKHALYLAKIKSSADFDLADDFAYNPKLFRIDMDKAKRSAR